MEAQPQKMEDRIIGVYQNDPSKQYFPREMVQALGGKDNGPSVSTMLSILYRQGVLGRNGERSPYYLKGSKSSTPSQEPESQKIEFPKFSPELLSLGERVDQFIFSLVERSSTANQVEEDLRKELEGWELRYQTWLQTTEKKDQRISEQDLRIMEQDLLIIEKDSQIEHLNREISVLQRSMEDAEQRATSAVRRLILKTLDPNYTSKKKNKSARVSPQQIKEVLEEGGQLRVEISGTQEQPRLTISDEQHRVARVKDGCDKTIKVSTVIGAMEAKNLRPFDRQTFLKSLGLEEKEEDSA
jgi:hypothetical protein